MHHVVSHYHDIFIVQRGHWFAESQQICNLKIFIIIAFIKLCLNWACLFIVPLSFENPVIPQFACKMLPFK